MSTESPIFLSKVECPICKTVNEFECIKVGAYVEKEHDTDFCPSERDWQNAKYALVNPLLYFMATCENCYYTREFKPSFRDWKNDTRFRTYQQKKIQASHLTKLAEEGSVLRMLGGARDPQQAPFPTAVAKFLLGIYDELLLERPRKLDLGRFFLRIGWLYREHNANSQKPVNHAALYARDIEKAYIRLKGSQENFENNLTNVSHLVEEQFKMAGSASPGGEFLAIQDSFRDSLEELKLLQQQLQNSLNGLSQSVQNNREVVSNVSCGDGGDCIPFGDYPSFQEFMAALKKKWEYVPNSEMEALLFAIEFYRAALEEGHEVQPGNQQIQATYLIAELSRRVGRNEEARQFFNNAIKVGQQFVFEHRGDKTRTALAQRILELALSQGKQNLAAASNR
ncbi:MAG: DUF2225 domain-containing protein [bacterium]